MKESVPEKMCYETVKNEGGVHYSAFQLNLYCIIFMIDIVIDISN